MSRAHLQPSARRGSVGQRGGDAIHDSSGTARHAPDERHPRSGLHELQPNLPVEEGPLGGGGALEPEQLPDSDIRENGSRAVQGCGAFGVDPHRKPALPSLASALVSAAFGSMFSSIAIFHARRESAGRVARPAAAGALKPAHEQARARRSTIWRAMADERVARHQRRGGSKTLSIGGANSDAWNALGTQRLAEANCHRRGRAQDEGRPPDLAGRMNGACLLSRARAR